jgi:hypothetical protein
MPIRVQGRRGMTKTDARKRLQECMKKVKLVYYQTGLGMKVNMSPSDQKKLMTIISQLDNIQYKLK